MVTEGRSSVKLWLSNLPCAYDCVFLSLLILKLILQMGWIKQTWFYMQKHWRLVKSYVKNAMIQLVWDLNEVLQCCSTWKSLLWQLLRNHNWLLIMQKLRHGSLILLRNGEKPKTWPILYYLDILLVVMLLLNIRSRWISSHIVLHNFFIFFCWLFWCLLQSF